MANLQALRAGLSIYAEQHGGAYPPPEKWCDSLVGRYVREEYLRCRRGEGGPCDYAMNPLAGPRGATDVVLLFECSSGWNRSGGTETLTTKHHEGQGCTILFVGGDVKFVKTEEIPALRWDGRGGGANEEGK